MTHKTIGRATRLDLYRRAEKALLTRARPHWLGTRKGLRRIVRCYVRRNSDTTALRGLLRSAAMAAATALLALQFYAAPVEAATPSFVERTGVDNPMDGMDVGFASNPAFADLNNDGDFDLLVGATGGSFFYFENTGNVNNPSFVERTGVDNPMDGMDVGSYSTPVFSDLDGDGDLDILSGSNGGEFYYFENTGDVSNPIFIERTGTDNPMDTHSIRPGFRSTPAFVDLDGDGDMDVLSGEGDAAFFYFENTGDVNNPSFVERTGMDNPMDGYTVIPPGGWGYYSTPTFADLDGDGDLDILSGSYSYSSPYSYGWFYYFENTGDLNNPIFTERTSTDNPMDGVNVERDTSPAFADLDGDGDLDMLTGRNGGQFHYFENTTAPVGPPTAPGIGVSPPAIDTGPVVVYASKDSTVTLTNTGDADLDIINLSLIQGNTGFSLVQPSAPVSPGSDSTVTLRFTPQAPGLLADTLVITHNADGNLSLVPLSGIGLARGDLDMDDRVTVLDIIRVVRIIIGQDAPPPAGTTEFHIADVNNDEAINVIDLIRQVNIILGIPGEPLDKAVAHGPVTAGLGEMQHTGGGYLMVPVVLESSGSIAGLQAVFTFDPSLMDVGTPSPAGSAAGFDFYSHVDDGTLRVVVYRTDIEKGFITGSGSVLLVPVRVKEGVWVTPSISLTDMVLSDGQARHVPVQLAVTRMEALPSAFALHEARPNPFNPSTSISYEVPQQAHITLTVYNLLGQEVARLVDEAQSPGRYRAVWQGRNADGQAVASGVYLYRLVSSTGYSENKRMTIVK